MVDIKMPAMGQLSGLEEQAVGCLKVHFCFLWAEGSKGGRKISWTCGPLDLGVVAHGQKDLLHQSPGILGCLLV